MDAKVRELLMKAKDSALNASRSAGKAATGLVEQARRNIRIVELNSEIETSYKNLGKMLYAVHTGVEIPSDSIDEALMEIDAKKEEIGALRESVQKSKADAVCPVCGKYIGKKAVFCSACGTKIDRNAAGQEPAAEPEKEAEDCVAEAEACVKEAEQVFRDACEEAGETAEAVTAEAEAAAEEPEAAARNAEDFFESVVDTFKKEDNE